MYNLYRPTLILNFIIHIIHNITQKIMTHLARLIRSRQAVSIHWKHHTMYNNVMITRNRQRVTKTATVSVNMEQYNEDDVGVSVWACPIYGGGRVVWCGPCLRLRVGMSSCVRGGVVGSAEGREEVVTHQLTAQTTRALNRWCMCVCACVCVFWCDRASPSGGGWLCPFDHRASASSQLGRGTSRRRVSTMRCTTSVEAADEAK